MPRKKMPLATTFAEKKSKAFKVKQRKATSAFAAAKRAENRAKRLIERGMLLSAPSATPRRTRKASAVSFKVGKRKSTATPMKSVTKGCSTAGRELKTRKTSRAGKYLVTKCKTGASVGTSTKRKSTTTKRKSTTAKSAVPKIKVGAGTKPVNPLKAVAKVVKSVLGGGTKKRTATKKTTTAKKRVMSKASSSKLARIRRIVC